MNQKIKARDTTIQKYYSMAYALKNLFQSIEFTHIPRELNKITDQLAKKKREEMVSLMLKNKTNPQ